MSFRSAVTFVASLAMMALLAGCGSNSSTPSAPGQSMTTLSQLNGTYAFSVTGEDSNPNGAEPFAMVGAFTANGSGGITAGAMDFNDPNVGQGTLTINSGSYSVGSDGRGMIKITASQIGAVTFDFVLTSVSHGLMTRFDSGGSGSGSFDLQNSPSLASSYAFSFSGVNANTGAILSDAGAFTLTNGAVSGVQDMFTGVEVAEDQPISGTVTLGSGTTPGTAQLATPLGTISFDVYGVDATHLKFVESDTTSTEILLSGDAFTQANASIPTGAAVFTAAGIVGNGSGGSNPLATGGVLTFSAGNAGGAISSGTVDINDGGSDSTLAVTGSYTGLSGGRAVMTLSNPIPGSEFAIYPSSGGIFIQEIDGVAVAGGAALAQTATTFSTSGGYGLNVSAANSSNEVDDIAAFTVTSTNISGTIDENDQGFTLSPNQALSGTYAASGAPGRGTMALQNGSFNANFYVADASTVLLIETDTGQVGTGSFLGQTAVGDSASAILRAAIAAHKAGAHPNLKKMRNLNVGSSK